MIKKELRQELFELLSVRFEKLMTNKEYRSNTHLDDGVYEGDISVDEDRFYLSLHAKKTGYKLHEISVTYVDEGDWVVVSKSYHGGKVSEHYYYDNVFYVEGLGILNEVLDGVIDAIRSEAQVIRIIQLLNDVVDVELYNRLDRLVDFIDVGLYLKSNFRTNILALGPAFGGRIELELGFEGDGVKLTANLFNKVTGKLIYKFEVLKVTGDLKVESTLYSRDGVSVDKTVCFGNDEVTDDAIYECISILVKTEYKDALIDLITCSGF